MDDIQKVQGEINAYKQILTNTDYLAIKYAEGELSESEYHDTKVQRRECRDRIHELEDYLKWYDCGNNKKKGN
jgi:uncharacterized protein YutD